MDRRTFLATPLVFGFRELFAQEADPKVADWFTAALKRMKETDRYGVVLVVPNEERARQSMGLVLNRMLTEDPAAAHQLFAGAVFICMTAPLADGRVRKSGETENRLLLAPDGKRIAADEMAWTIVGKAALAEMVEGLRKFLHGEKGERLAEHAARIEKRLTDEVRAALRALDAEDFEERSKASTVVLKNAAGMVPYLIRVAATDESLERRWRAGAAVKEIFQTGGKIPFGCSTQLEYFDPCPGCGLARTPEPARHFLRFLSS
jgi:hypothetical protein